MHEFMLQDLAASKLEAPASVTEDEDGGVRDDELAPSTALAVPDEYGYGLAGSGDHEQSLGEEGFADTPPEHVLPAVSSRHSLLDLQVKLRFHRADLYLGLAVFVAAAALLWPTGTPQQPSLPLWERTLIAIGIADAPPQAARYHGDPNLKVWVDTHAALYYCPGDELYGKSSGGHFTTQHEAQADRFEPAEASACIQ
jgi:hypothetical protein